jgi:hypothetical protein
MFADAISREKKGAGVLAAPVRERNAPVVPKRCILKSCSGLIRDQAAAGVRASYQIQAGTSMINRGCLGRAALIQPSQAPMGACRVCGNAVLERV